MEYLQNRSRMWNDFIAIDDKMENSNNRLSYCIAG